MTRYRSSGLQPQPFAEQHGLKLSTLRRWIQQEGYTRLPNAEAAGLVGAECRQKNVGAEPTGKYFC